MPDKAFVPFRNSGNRKGVNSLNDVDIARWTKICGRLTAYLLFVLYISVRRDLTSLPRTLENFLSSNTVDALLLKIPLISVVVALYYYGRKIDKRLGSMERIFSYYFSCRFYRNFSSRAFIFLSVATLSVELYIYLSH